MDNIRFYEINAKYVDYLAPYAPHLFHNSKKEFPIVKDTTPNITNPRLYDTA